MKPIKNKKRIDPRYFLDETVIKEEPAKLSEVTLTQAPRRRRIR
jgi:hypothetical protein